MAIWPQKILQRRLHCGLGFVGYARQSHVQHEVTGVGSDFLETK
jgi:hypothetical protein